MASIAARKNRQEYYCQVRHRVNRYVAGTLINFINFINDITRVGLAGTEGKVLFVAPSAEEEGGGKLQELSFA
jgi:hypothetical protein